MKHLLAVIIVSLVSSQAFAEEDAYPGQMHARCAQWAWLAGIEKKVDFHLDKSIETLTEDQRSYQQGFATGYAHFYARQFDMTVKKASYQMYAAACNKDDAEE